MHGPTPVRSLEEAAAFVERVGIAVVYPKADVVLPSLWEAVAGRGELEWAVRDEGGKFVSFTPEFEAVWRLKDELPERRLGCAGKHLGRVAGLVAPTLVGALYALTGRRGKPNDFLSIDGLTPLQLDAAEAVLEYGPCTGPELRRLLGFGDKKRIDDAVTTLQRQLVLTNAGVAEQEQGWPAIRLDVFARRWRERIRRLPSEDDARLELAGRVLVTAGELSAADLAGALGWRRPDAAAALEALADSGLAGSRDEDGTRIWRRTLHA